MKNFVKTNTFLVIISIVAAIFLWIYVVYEVSPQYETWIDDVPVKCINTSELFNDGSLLVIGENEKILSGSYTINVRIKGKRSTVSSVDRENLSCTLDMVTVTKYGEYDLKPAVDTDISGIEIVKTDPYSIKLNVEDVMQKDLAIQIETTGDEKEGCTLGDLESKNESVKITGPYSVISEVASAKVSLNLNELDITDMELSCPIKFYDSEGNEYDSTKFEKTVEYAKLTFNFYTKKEVTLVLMPKYKDEINKNLSGKNVELAVEGEGKTTDDGGLELKLTLEGPVNALDKYDQSKRMVYTEDIDVANVYSDTVFEGIKAAELTNNVKYTNIPEVKVRATVDNG